MIISPPSSYTLLSGETFTYEYNGGEILPFPKWVFDLKKLRNQKT